MSTPRPVASATGAPDHEVLGYLLKHAHLALQARSDGALAELGITSRDVGALRVITTNESLSQQEVAAVLGVDRTTMVGLLDALQAAGLVERRPSEHDRRRNVLSLTDRGQDLFRRADGIAGATDARFLAPLGPDATEAFLRSLRTLLHSNEH